ncbi:MAG: glycerophosphodiester phosphodiesterase [Planctomycetaceae bacterium]|nr:glycerophosphodiester phosphodiesterase [Planctomycetaceae bacterium]
MVSTSVCQAQFIVAHRGASFDAPENTLAAFRLAWEQQADAIEGDFYLTKDGQIVCIHDKTTKRTAAGQPELTVAESTLAELQSLDVGSWKNARFAGERIPTLTEVLAAVPPGKKIFVEVKCGPEIIPALKTQLEQSALKPEQIVIICFNQDVISGVRREMPQYKASWLTGYKQNDTKTQWKPTQKEVLTALRTTGATGLGTQGQLSVINDAFAKAIADAGVELHVWTVNEPADARRFAELGVLSITTDKPVLIREALSLVQER